MSLYKNFIKILILETIPLKSRVNGFLKRNRQEFIFQYRVFVALAQLTEGGLGRSKPTTNLGKSTEHTVWNISTIFKPY
jgi:hypothetical protein